MEQIGNRQFIEIPGSKDTTFELPPFLMANELHINDVIKLAEEIVEIDDMIEIPNDYNDSSKVLEGAKMDLAVNMADQYKKIFGAWHLGEAILEWIRQCEITFKYSTTLRSLLYPDIWPHASRNSFIGLLSDKSVCSQQGAKMSVGMRLTYREPLPIQCCTSHFLFYLVPQLTETAYDMWAERVPKPVLSLPPERFHFHVVKI